MVWFNGSRKGVAARRMADGGRAPRPGRAAAPAHVRGHTPAEAAGATPVTVMADTEPATPTVLRLRPRRAWLPRVSQPDTGCGWFESSRELRQGMDVQELDLYHWLLAD
jgi:hypothetical protein